MMAGMMAGMARRNRVDPWGDLHAVAPRGLFTGNRGCLVNAAGEVVRHHQSQLWITCVTELGGRRQPLAALSRWTPIFFLDEAVALAAGHRPCAYCRRDAYRGYRDAVSGAVGRPVGEPLRAWELDRMLVAERHRRGRGLARAADRLMWQALPAGLPPGTVVLAGPSRRPALVGVGGLQPFNFDGWGPLTGMTEAPVEVLTPPTSVAALAGGFQPVLHPSATS